MLLTTVDFPVPLTPADQDIQVLIEIYDGAIQKTAFPGYGFKLGLLHCLGLPFPWVQPNAGPWIEEGLTQTFDANVGHLDPARR